MDEIKQIKNLFKKLIKDKNSIFYLADKISRTLLDKSTKIGRHTKKAKFFIKCVLD